MTPEAENANLRKALAQCLETINSYFGLTDDQMNEAIAEAIKDPENWSPYRH